MYELEMAKKIRELEKEIRYLKTLEKGTGGGVTAHGDLSGLGNDDHTQYLNETRGDARYLGISAKAADSDKLDGIDSTGFATAGHDHDSDYLGITAKAADSAKLGGIDAASWAWKPGFKTSNTNWTFQPGSTALVTDPVLNFWYLCPAGNIILEAHVTAYHYDTYGANAYFYVDSTQLASVAFRSEVMGRFTYVFTYVWNNPTAQSYQFTLGFSANGSTDVKMGIENRSLRIQPGY